MSVREWIIGFFCVFLVNHFLPALDLPKEVVFWLILFLIQTAATSNALAYWDYYKGKQQSWTAFEALGAFYFVVSTGFFAIKLVSSVMGYNSSLIKLWALDLAEPIVHFVICILAFAFASFRKWARDYMNEG